MSSSLLLSRLPGPATAGNNRDLCSSISLHKSTFLSSQNLIFAPSGPSPRAKNGVRGGCPYRSPVASSKSLDHIPKQFREENLKEGLMENYKNVPQTLYGLTPSQMDLFLKEDSHVHRQSESVTEESISSRHNYLNNGGMWTMSSMNGKRPSKMSYSMYYGGARGYGGRPRSAPPDLPSLLLDARIVYLGMPIVPAVSELLVAQFLWLDYDNPTKPIYLYINSHGTQNEKKELVGSETDAYAIADAMRLSKPDVCTVNVGKAYGQAGMLLSLGKKGFRALQASASTKLYLPDVYKSSGPVTEMWIKAKELEANKDYYLELLSKGIGKPKEEIERDIQRPAYFTVQEAIDYGIADKIIDPKDSIFEKRDYEGMLAQSRAMRRAAGSGAQAAAGSGFR
ncbi:ATP-dependent Clp protease proteolytic subunit-related protein 1, chloroplastic [Ipomoea triloba]|uniref:ATP-dependent Clp protease proteolytic subunit-related protein 1, chloroplastic n=1 Tax=Ipomoea triloba TaxID=35885 RepID=UPI00125E485B|nr:ATP-dependent Clp protease proteolytic subunit-related protein 1, chloroplastic [Ipomoea triloba]